MKTKGFIALLLILASALFVTQSRLSLRHNFFSTSSFSTPSFVPQVPVPSSSTAVGTVETCKNIGSTWNSITGKIDNWTPTWTGGECDNQCTAQKGIVCGKYMKDCCAMECQGNFVYSYCKFDLKLTKKMMACGAWSFCLSFTNLTSFYLKSVK